MSVIADREHPALTGRGLALLLLTLGAAAAPHAAHLPWPILLLALACGAWRWKVTTSGWPFPGALLRAMLAFIGCAAVAWNWGTVFGRDPGTALLVIMLALKLLEVRSYRDAMLTLFLACFLAVVMAFHSQEIPVALALIATLALAMCAMIELNTRSDAPGNKGLLREAIGMMAWATPAMMVMFILFPRLPAPLWGLPADAHGGVTGLAETMSPGGISHLAGSDAVAFRVQFDGPVPSPEQLYWRGPVLWHTDGRNWSGAFGRNPPALRGGPDFEPRGNAVTYSVMLEPSRQRWLFALDLPYTAPPGAAFTSDMMLLSEQPIREQRHYRVTSHASYRTGPLRDAERIRALQLPQANPRTIALGRRWRGEASTAEDVLRQALAHFRNESFYYTLTPPLLQSSDPVDEFLFGSRRGFCEHYAAAFTVLMRAAGIPARVVTGYQGGDINPVGNYLVVRQRDAHAWAEVWLAESGWTRIDPTAAVAPERIERGSADLRERGPFSARSALREGVLGSLIQRAQYSWDALGVRWDSWVLAYGPELQRTVLARVGLRSWLTMVSAMVVMTLLILLVPLMLRRRSSAKADPAQLAYERFRRKLARRGVQAAPSEGPMAFAERARALRPELAGEIDLVTGLYVTMRYGNHRNAADVARLRREVARFRP
jgi:transglutaminase-like putative cysteine protease